MNSVFVLLMQLVAVAPHSSGPRLEVDQDANKFRVVVDAARTTRIYPWQLESPGSEFPPGSVYVLVKNEEGKVVGCGPMNAPHAAAMASSNSVPSNERKSLRLRKGDSFVTPWHKVGSLFIFFDECVKPERRGGYAEYKIMVEIDSSSGVLRAETGWLKFPGFETSGWSSVLKKQGAE